MEWPVPSSVAATTDTTDTDTERLSAANSTPDEEEEWQPRPRKRIRRPPEATTRRGAELAVYTGLQQLSKTLDPASFGEWHNEANEETVRLYFDQPTRDTPAWLNTGTLALTSAPVPGFFVLPHKKRGVSVAQARFPLPGDTIRFRMSSLDDDRRIEAYVSHVVQHPRASKRAVAFVLEQVRLL